MLIENSVLRSSLLSKYINLRHGTSTKQAGHLSFKKEPNSNRVIIDRNKFSAKIGVTADDKVVIGEQYHTGNARLVSEGDSSWGMFNFYSAVPRTDGLVTDKENVNLVVYTADCLPVLFYDPVRRVIGAAHAGWRGLIKDIIPHTLVLMIENFHCRPENIIAYVGPSICPDHFEVHREVAEKFEIKFASFLITSPAGRSDEQGEKYLVDLRQSAKVQFQQMGLKDNNIEISDICTWENNDLFASDRREKESRRDNNWSVIGMIFSSS